MQINKQSQKKTLGTPLSVLLSHYFKLKGTFFFVEGRHAGGKLYFKNRCGEWRKKRIEKVVNSCLCFGSIFAHSLLLHLCCFHILALLHLLPHTLKLKWTSYVKATSVFLMKLFLVKTLKGEAEFLAFLLSTPWFLWQSISS